MMFPHKDKISYCYFGSDVLKNKFGIRDPDKLSSIERDISDFRSVAVLLKTVPKLDAEYIRYVHRYLFQDIYEWAGEYRKVNLEKGGTWFAEWSEIEDQMCVLSDHLAGSDYGRSLYQKQDVCGDMVYCFSRLNYVHPFREGNGRVSRIFLKKFAKNAGYSFFLKDITQTEWLSASKSAACGDSSLLYHIFEKSVKRVDAGLQTSAVIRQAEQLQEQADVQDDGLFLI